MNFIIIKNMVCYILIILLFSNTVIAKDHIKDSLPLIEITNEDLLVLIDSFIEFEKKHNCYHTDYIYILAVNKQSDTFFYLEIASLGALKFVILSQDNYCFFYKGHLFFVRGDEPPEAWFRNTGVDQPIELNDFEEEVYTVIADLSSWSCWYKNGVFGIYDKHKCGFKPSQNN